MASSIRPFIATYLVGGTIVAGHAVKFGADAKHVVECTAASDKAIGIAVGGSSTLEDPIEVFRPGGGGKGICHTTTNLGDPLVAFTDGTLNVSASTGDRIIAYADDAGVAGDMIPVVVTQQLHY